VGHKIFAPTSWSFDGTGFSMSCRLEVT
jgi:hypothetical protein